MISEILILVLSFILISLVSGNNLPVCSGSIIESRIISRRNGILLTITGYIAGLLLEGDLIRRGASAILPFVSYKLSIIALSIGIIVFLISHKMRVPQSLSVNFTSILIGISLAMHLEIDWYFVMLIIIFWILAPIISIITIKPFMSFSYRISNGKRIWNVIKWVKLLLILFSFFAAFTLGANTIGLLYSILPKGYVSLFAVSIAIVFGSILFSKGELRRVGNEIISLRYINALNSQIVSVALVELATLFGIPLSNTQTFISSVYGSGLSYKNRFLLKAPIKSIAIAWVGGSLISFVISYLLASLLA